MGLTDKTVIDADDLSYIPDGFLVRRDAVVAFYCAGACVISGEGQLTRAEGVVLLTQVPCTPVEVSLRIVWIDPQLGCGCRHKLTQANGTFRALCSGAVAALGPYERPEKFRLDHERSRAHLGQVP